MVEFLGCYKRNFCLSGLILVLCTSLTACMVGPDFQKPKAPHLKSYTANKLPHKTVSSSAAGKAGVSQTLVYGRDIPGEWWQLFRSPQINKLVALGLENSPNLAAAKYALVQSQETYNAQWGNLLIPAFDGQLNGQRQKFSGSTFGGGVESSLFNLFNASINVAYTLDVFGGNRRELESLRAQAENQKFQLLAAYLTLTSNIVTTAVSIASYEGQISATKSLINAQVNQLKIMQRQYKLGGVALTNVLAQRTLVDQTRATLPPLQNSLSQSRHALAVLIGGLPNTKLPKIRLDSLRLPAEIPVSIPSKLVQQRPDVRASEALLHSASAQIGVATANIFPNFSITGNYGWTSSIPSTLFSPATNAFTIAAMITQPIYHGGAELAYRRAAIAAYDEAFAQYKQTLLQAFQNTSDSLRALETDARTLRDTKSAEIAARDALRIISRQYKLGGVSYLNLLNAQSQYQETRIASIQAKAARYADTAALFQSLGGGWWNNKQIQCSKDFNPTNASLTCPSQ